MMRQVASNVKYTFVWIYSVEDKSSYAEIREKDSNKILHTTGKHTTYASTYRAAMLWCREQGDNGA